MRRFIYILYIFAIIPVILGLCGCTNKPKEISEEALTTYLEKKYNDTFTLKDCKKFSPHKGTDILYTFESGSGIICHISKVYSGGFMGYTYSYQEDYPTMYLRKYPELLAQLMEGDFEAERIDTDNHYCFASNYILYFESYEEIETALEYIDDFLEKAQAIPDSGYIVPDKKITQIRPGITIGIKENNYQFGVYYHYPTEHLFDKKSVNDFLENAQDAYVKLVREGKLSETLSAEVLTKHPAPAIRNITFRDETVIDCVVYRKENSEYVIDQSCIEYKGCPFYPDKLATPLRTLGWSVKLSKRSIIWSKDADEVELCLKGYGMNHMQLHCFKNGKEYSMRGRLLWQSGTNPIVTMSESDLKYLFGMEFQFNQVHLTGELILNAS